MRAYTAPVVRLLDALDGVLRHGLKEGYRLLKVATEPPSYWPFVAKKTFPQNADYIQSITGSRPGLDNGRAWLALALTESSLHTYFQQFLEDRKLVGYARPPARSLRMAAGRANCRGTVASVRRS